MDELPSSCSYLALGAARIREIKAIVDKLDNCEHGGRAFQNLPRHMQRRTVSANPKRLPHYLRDRHMREGGANVKTTKRPKKKYRHRPNNLLAEYNRRQSEYLWLETHVWHAKRFHMTRKWGYALSESPTMKGYRSTLRAATKTCTVQDVSYLCCIELEGTRASLLAGLAPITQSLDLVKLKSPEVLQGKKWVSLVLFMKDKKPYGALGSVDILWHPKPGNHQDTKETENSKLWLWVHPSAHFRVVNLLMETYNLKKKLDEAEDVIQTKDQEKKLLEEPKGGDSPMEIEEINLEPNSESKDTEALAKISNSDTPVNKKNGKKEKVKGNCHSTKKNVNDSKMAKKNVPFVRTPKYNAPDSSVKMTLLKDTINRFHVTGPKSYNVLNAALYPADITLTKKDNLKDQPWWHQYYHDEDQQVIYKHQLETWKSFSSRTPAPHSVLPMTIRDPRITLPHKKLPLKTSDPDTKVQVETSDWPVASPFFDNGLRDEVTLTKEEDSVINKKRSKMLVPGERATEDPDEAKLPILLMSRPPTHSAGHGAGWDILIPAGWAMSVWMSLIFCGGVAVGLKESLNLVMEALTPLPPFLMPDTPSGETYSTEEGQERQEEYFKRPPSARHNFIKLGVQYPFSAPWRRLISNWKEGTGDFFVLRDITLLNKLAGICGDASNRIKARNIGKKRKAIAVSQTVPYKSAKIDPYLETITECKVTEEESGLDTFSATAVEDVVGSLRKIDTRCLVMVRLQLEGKGTLEPCTMICLPQLEDLKDRLKPEKLLDQSNNLQEPHHKDTRAEQRVQLREEHKKIGSKLQRLRKKARAKVSEEHDITNVADISFAKKVSEALEKTEVENQEIIAKFSTYQKTMEDLWLMPRETPLQCCSRKIMGYITQGTFCITLGVSGGVGWVALEPLMQLLLMHEKFYTETSEINELQNPSRKGKSRSSHSVLIRCPSTSQYQWAGLTIVVQPE
ncbi:ribonucleases P/MRP protein subunit POP1-like [Penaeus chinensis]|uniref:ribonucleases P/MRP protein subunit POP1-like n=1 Tax=Penaeus chinensis TaxID=139456 RepID=UPI001FB720E4|nr:ribonucleases P/MRP protein subunit POP1-like [Penaeus chinensis]XP_047492473.1 ribonucleases P/MRP protein subunit POP1-like [Penaeus chinensis]